jgi:pilus assembly protein CpaC
VRILNGASRRHLLIPAVIAAVATATGGVGVEAQAPAQATLQQAPSTSAATLKIPLTAGRSTVLSVDFDVTRIAITDPAIANAVVVEPRQLLIDGKAPGTVSLIVWGVDQQRQYDIVVDPGISTLEQRLQALFPDEDLHVTTNDKGIILSGHVSGNAVSLQVAEIARATSPDANVINLLQVPGGPASQQVLLQVRFAEVSRRALTEAGVSLFTSPTGVKNTIMRSTTQQFAAPSYDGLQYTKENGDFGSAVTSAEGTFTFSDFLNLFVFSEKYDLGAMIRALQNKGLFQSLAEPNLIAYNGQQASFLAGGEIPIPVVQGGSGTNAVSVQFKEYGIRLNFTPTIVGDTIRLKVNPEVSTLDFANGIVLSGFRIPALATRRAQTDVELRDGQSFAIAGLLNNLSQDDANEVPGLAKLPIIGRLFKSRSTRTEQNELMVLITPRLVRPLNPDEVPPLPTIEQNFLPPPEGIGGTLQGGGGVSDGPEVNPPSGGQPQGSPQPQQGQSNGSAP